jgi:hypothetical protein
MYIKTERQRIKKDQTKTERESERVNVNWQKRNSSEDWVWKGK